MLKITQLCPSPMHNQISADFSVYCWFSQYTLEKDNGIDRLPQYWRIEGCFSTIVFHQTFSTPYHTWSRGIYLTKLYKYVCKAINEYRFLFLSSCDLWSVFHIFFGEILIFPIFLKLNYWLLKYFFFNIFKYIHHLSGFTDKCQEF